ncbi:hypothetical protein [Diplocloster modestus]|uniref:ABC-2 family transporter protein n=1 Tax=Diplocloster modestus TaxID=2850322 RepID=A0ABS6K7W2_9FIRM|nr:hypothetical protein [Diplocloster modestus]MBU9726604.1 hypothetical protein [Diplocloster modestus]
MREYLRVFTNRRLWLGFGMLLLLNLFFFWQAQKDGNYGMNLSANFSNSADLSFGINAEIIDRTMDADAARCLRIYRNLLQKYRDTDTWTAQAELEQMAEDLGLLTELYIIVQNKDQYYYADQYEEYRLKYAPYIKKLEQRTWTREDIKSLTVAVDALLSQLSYLNGYEDYLDGIRENKDRMLAFSVFSDTDGFSGRNIIRTAADFEDLTGVQLSLGADGAVNALLDFPLTDYLLLLTLILVCLSFLEEREKGLWCVIHAALSGRFRLAAARAGILFCVSAGASVLLYGSDLYMGIAIYGGEIGLDRAAQSVELLGKLPQACTLGGFLVQFFMMRVLSAFILALLLWLLLSAVHDVKLTIAVLTIFLGAEYVLYRFLPVQSLFNIFKYFNIFSYIHLSELYTNYLNVDLFGYPVGIRRISQTALLPLGLVCGIWCAVLACVQKPAGGKSRLVRLSWLWNSVKDRMLRHLGLFGMELYKILFLQRGIVIAAVFVYAVSGLTFTIPVQAATLPMQLAREYLVQWEGELNGETQKQIAAVQKEIDTAEDALEQAQREYDGGKIDYTQLSACIRENDAAGIKRQALQSIQNRVNELQILSEEKGRALWLLDESVYESIYGEEAGYLRQRAALVGLLAVGLLLAGCFAYEARSGMNRVARAGWNGRGKWMFTKITAALLVATAVWGLIYGREVYTMMSTCRVDSLGAPVQSLKMLTEFPVPCSIGTFLILLYGYRWIMLVCSGFLVLWVSSRMKRMEPAYMAGAGVLLPSLLYHYIGIKPFRYLALSMPVAAMDLLLPGSGSAFRACVVGGLMTAMGIGSLCLIRREVKYGSRLGK